MLKSFDKGCYHIRLEMESIVNRKITSHWFILLSIVVLIKLTVFIIDPLPMFFLGDSHCYIATSLTGWIPLDRSFVYGFFIKIVAVYAGSLYFLVITQIVASVVTVMLLYDIMVNYLNVKIFIAIIIAILCAIEPLQLMYERFVMTETLTLLVFAIYFKCIFSYLRFRKLYNICLIQLAGTMLISLRLSYLPIITVNTIMLPMLSYFQNVRRNVSNSDVVNTSAKPGKDQIKYTGFTVVHIITSISLFIVLHSGYKYLNGYLSNKPPAYQYQSGTFLLSDWAPIVSANDFPLQELNNQVFDNLRYDLKDRHMRNAQHWFSGGIIDNINKTIPDIITADKVAKETAINALKRDPISLINLCYHSFTDYYDKELLLLCMANDRGDRELPKELLSVLESRFKLNATQFPYLMTFSKTYFMVSCPWYQILMLAPIYALCMLILCNKSITPYAIVVFTASAGIFAVAIALIEGPTVRYLHGQAWLVFIVFGYLLNWGYNKCFRCNSL